MYDVRSIGLLRYLAAMMVDVTLGVMVSWVMVRFFDILFGKVNLNVPDF